MFRPFKLKPFQDSTRQALKLKGPRLNPWSVAQSRRSLLELVQCKLIPCRVVGAGRWHPGLGIWAFKRVGGRLCCEGPSSRCKKRTLRARAHTHSIIAGQSVDVRSLRLPVS